VLRKAVEDDGGSYSDVLLVPKDVGDIKAALGNEADAVWIYKNWEYYVMKHAGRDVNYFAFADVDPLFDFCAPAVSATHEMADNYGEQLRAFLGATDRGFIAAANDPDGCAQIMMRYMPHEKSELVLDSQRYISQLYLDSSGHWGYISPSRWDDFADFMVGEGIIKGRTPREYTNGFLRQTQC